MNETLKMTPRTVGVPRAQKSRNFRGDGTNWVLIAGGALLSTLSLRLCYKLKQLLDTKTEETARNALKGKGMSSERRKTSGCRLHSNTCSFVQDDEACFTCMPGREGMMEIKCPPNSQMLGESDGPLPLVTVPTHEFHKENGVLWSSSPDRLELPPKRFHHSNCSDSPCVSDSGSDIFSKREVIYKLRQQLKRRDDMILEMQDQILELQNSLNAQVANSSHLQSQLDDANRELFVSEGEIQLLRKAIADHCMAHVGPTQQPERVSIWPREASNGHQNGYLVEENKFEVAEKGRCEREKIEQLKKEVGELKEVIEGKEFLLQSYKEQKTELSMKVKEMQLRLDSQLPNIL